ncbi:preprotein translocase subunit SecG [Oceanicoccus sp. KOV_DT_Chl]|uniref:preprotein translocase subunit SecG n=1 Tax=Oceanicoccus sp. KOV_DT_Chl TaxID=1904639 RepID=UPI000C7E7C5B|nr:preprotein translocase subunit SecG [Oceanicoccus sp. KOV_DT_Chl]
MEQIILIIHMLIALAIIGLIMIQQGKGADMGASFGAGSSQTLFGSGGGGSVLTLATTWLVALFFATSFGLAVIAKNNSANAGAVDLPIPAVVESKSAADVEIPAIDEQALQESMGTMADDIPEIGASTTTPAESDIPE